MLDSDHEFSAALHACVHGAALSLLDSSPGEIDPAQGGGIPQRVLCLAILLHLFHNDFVPENAAAD